MTIYDFSAPLPSGESVPLSRYRGRVLLIVNTASACGFTPQYAGLQTLYEKLEAEGLTILGFPCNQFGAQEPGDDSEILRFCQANFAVTFPVFAKVEVNGDHALPLFQYLKEEKKGLLGTEGIKWNFTKFLVNREGEAVGRYAPQTKPEDLEEPIRALL